MEKPNVKLSSLKKGNCFMYNGQAFIVKKTYWEDLGRGFKRKIYICRMKFDDYDSYFSPNEDVYQISRGLFDLLVQADN